MNTGTVFSAIVGVTTGFFFVVGAVVFFTWLGKKSVRWSQAIDELIYQRKQRKSNTKF